MIQQMEIWKTNLMIWIQIDVGGLGYFLFNKEVGLS